MQVNPSHCTLYLSLCHLMDMFLSVAEGCGLRMCMASAGCTKTESQERRLKIVCLTALT